MTGRPKNKAEAALFDELTADGWFVTKKGWPDFSCFKNDRLILVEVKPKRSHALKKMQHQVMLALAERHIPCYRWSPDGGFEPITPSTRHV